MKGNKSKMSYKRGFTLIELLVVVLIIGILAAVAVPQYQKAVIKSRFTEAMITLKSVGQAARVCMLEQGRKCGEDEMDIIWPSYTERNGNTTAIRTGSGVFSYSVENPNDEEDSVLVRAWDIKRDEVCLCYFEDGTFGLDQSGECGNSPSYDYATLLGVADVGYENCQCC